MLSFLIHPAGSSSAREKRFSPQQQLCFSTLSMAAVCTSSKCQTTLAKQPFRLLLLIAGRPHRLWFRQDSNHPGNTGLLVVFGVFLERRASPSPRSGIWARSFLQARSFAIHKKAGLHRDAS